MIRISHAFTHSARQETRISLQRFSTMRRPSAPLFPRAAQALARFASYSLPIPAIYSFVWRQNGRISPTPFQFLIILAAASVPQNRRRRSHRQYG